MAERVRAVALDLFAEKGYNATSMRDIARAADLSPGAFYHHYTSKEAILLDIMSSNMKRLMDRALMGLQEAGDDPESRLRALVRVHVLDHGEYRNSAIVVDTEMRALSPDSLPAIREIRDAYEALWRNAIEDLARPTPPPFDLSLIRFAIIQMCTGVAAWYRVTGPLSLEKIATQFSDIAVNMIVHGGADQ